MSRTAIVAALCCVLSCCATVSALAKSKPALHASCNILWPCDTSSASTPDQVRETRGRYIARQMGIGGPVKRRARRAALPRPALSYGAPSPVADNLAKPMRFITGRLVCAINVNAALAERGIRGTGSALALSFMRWGHSAGGPVPGAVIVSRRRGGGHVAIVSRVVGGKVYAWNATGGRRDWREIPYRHRVLDYRMPG